MGNVTNVKKSKRKNKNEVRQHFVIVICQAKADVSRTIPFPKFDKE